MHFAFFIQVGESVRLPGRYYCNDVCNTQGLTEAMAAAGGDTFIFSATAAVFGELQSRRIDESHPRCPDQPVRPVQADGRAHARGLDRAHGLRSVSLCCFNAAGADPSGLLGERHEPETRLIPPVLQAAWGRGPHIDVFGRDHPTPDGICIRDDVHVEDLCRAHLLALEYLADGGAGTAFNLGNGDGFPVQELIDAAARVSGRRIASRDGPGGRAMCWAGGRVTPGSRTSSPTPGAGKAADPRA